MIGRKGEWWGREEGGGREAIFYWQSLPPVHNSEGQDGWDPRMPGRRTGPPVSQLEKEPRLRPGLSAPSSLQPEAAPSCVQFTLTSSSPRPRLGFLGVLPALAAV